MEANRCELVTSEFVYLLVATNVKKLTDEEAKIEIF